MGLLTISTWAELVECVSNSPIGAELLRANNFTAFEDLLFKEGAKHGITMAQNTLATGAEVATDTSIATYTTYATEGLTGGVSTATQVATLAETEAGVTVTTVGASAGAVSLGAIVGGVIGGLGLGLVAYELTPEFWTGISNAIFGTDIHYDNIEDYSILTLFKDGKTYIDSKIIDKVRLQLEGNNAFITNKKILAPNTHIAKNEVVSFQVSTLTYEKFYNLCSIANTHYTVHSTSYKDFSKLDENVPQFWNLLITNIPSYLSYNVYSLTINSKSCQIFFRFYKIPTNNCTGNGSLFTNTDGTKASSVTSNVIETHTITLWGTNGSGIFVYEQNHATVAYKDSFMIGLRYVDGDGLIEISNANTDVVSEIGYHGLVLNQNSVLPQPTVPLQTTYPSWYQNALTIGGIKPDKSGIQQVQYLPIALPTVNPMTTDLAIPQAQAQLGDVTETPQQQTLLDALARLQQSIPNYPYVQSPPSTDIGNTPSTPTVLPSAAASGLISIYNPTLAEVNSFGGYLWSSDITAQLLKLFQNPMDAIIGLHILYGTPSTNGRGHIKVGYLDTGVESNLVSNQYITIDCGSIQVPELNGNATDYPPYTRTSLYLPFIGIVELNGYDIIGSSVSIEYKIDVLTGCCLANVKINKNSSNAILYTYNGNCAVQLPLTGGNYSAIISGLIGVGLGAMTGGVGMAVAGVMGAVSHGATVQHSGCLGSNSGAMGIKKPYLVVTRFVPYDAVNYNNYYGYPSNITQKISSLTGFTKVKEIRLNGITATNKEKLELETILKKGVIF